MMKKNILYIIGILLFSVGCDDYLDKVPDNRTELDNLGAINELLTTAYPLGAYNQFCEVMSDNAGDKGHEVGADRDMKDAYIWKTIQGTFQDTPTYYWNQCYNAIAAANQALESVEALGLSEDKTKETRGEALMCRAYAHFMLANLFCEPYDSNILESSLGIPYVTEPERVLVKEYKRGTLKETYDKIRADMEEGLQLIGDSYNVPRYHFTTVSSAAFATRFYLTIGEWENVIKYADLALGVNPQTKLRDWSTGSFYSAAGYYEIKDRYSSVEDPANLLLASTLSWWERSWIGRYTMTDDISNQIFKKRNNPLSLSLKYKVFGNDLYRNVPKIKEYFKKNSLNATSGKGYIMVTLFSGDEVLLNRAEAYAMLNMKNKSASDIALFYSKKTDKSYAEIMKLITDNKIEKFYEDNESLEFNPSYDIPSDVLAYVKCITHARRAEFIHEGMRWFDIRRLGIAIVHEKKSDSSDDEELLLTSKDPRKIIQIPADAISFGLQPNNRD